jgi:hypothetical protein
MDGQQELETEGRLWRRGLLSPREARAFAQHCDVGERPGVRLDFTSELVRYLGPASVISRQAERIGVDATPVRILSFNKPSSANWTVPWHQDRVIAVADHIEVSGYSNWVAKGPVWHCEPPIGLLHSMVFIRVHFDGCDETNGAIEIALGSNRKGFVDARQAKDVAEMHEIEVCRANPGDVLIVKALTLHRSSSSHLVGSRRALRVDYARRNDLDPRLSWSIPTG